MGASMGPPPFGGGNDTTAGRDVEVEVKLQWGLRLSAVEIWSPRRGWSRTCGFNGASAFRRWKWGPSVLCSGGRSPASMGPPPFGGGNPGIRRRGTPSPGWLQWGLRLSAVEICQRMTSSETGRRGLQWGLRLSAVEIGFSAERLPEHPAASMGPPPFGGGNAFHKGVYNYECAGFNGASAFRRWKSRYPSSTRPESTSFNGASAFRRWK